MSFIQKNSRFYVNKSYPNYSLFFFFFVMMVSYMGRFLGQTPSKKNLFLFFRPVALVI